MTFKKLIYALTLAALAAGVAACEKPEPYDGATAVSLRPEVLEQAGGTAWVSVTCKGAWSLAVECSDGGSWASVTPASGSGNKGDVQLIYKANEKEEVRSVTVILKPVNGAERRATVSQAGVEPEPVYGYDVAPMSWLELPATEAGDGRSLLVHAMNGEQYRSRGFSGVRNWSCYWDFENRVSVWVAYPMNNSLKGSGSRTDLWGYDPLLPQDAQQSITMRFSTNRYYSDPLYDRGHQIPSADRLNREANISTFYATNMTPQSGSFNSGIWATLEGKVRGYAGQADTLYVVTGCIVDNTNTYVRDVAGHQIAVPTAYYKALLYKGNSSYATATKGYMAAGFLLPHDDNISDKNCLSYICSIDALEEKTGMDFFPALEKVLDKETAATIEASEPSNWWK